MRLSKSASARPFRLQLLTTEQVGPDAQAMRPPKRPWSVSTARRALRIATRSRSSAALRRSRNRASHSLSGRGRSSLRSAPPRPSRPCRRTGACTPRATGPSPAPRACRSTPLVMGSLSTSTPSQSNSTAPKRDCVKACLRPGRTSGHLSSRTGCARGASRRPAPACGPVLRQRATKTTSAWVASTCLRLRTSRPSHLVPASSSNVAGRRPDARSPAMRPCPAARRRSSAGA